MTKPMTDLDWLAIQASAVVSLSPGEQPTIELERDAWAEVVAEVDRLRRLDRLAREWLAAFDGDNGPSIVEHEAREAYSAAIEQVLAHPEGRPQTGS